MKNALVSCIVPVFNGERYLSEALDSILAQTHRHLEIIVADDGSADGSAEVAARYEEPVRWVTQDTRGPAAARNLGLREARGELVAFLDADDLWHAEKLARQIARFEARPELDVSVTHIENFWIEELRDEKDRLRDDPRTKPLPGYVTMTMLTRRSFFDQVGPFDDTLWHTDSMDWFLRAAEHDATIELLPDTLVYHRMHSNNLSRRQGPEGRQEFLQIVKRSLESRRKSGREALPFEHFLGPGV